MNIIKYLIYLLIVFSVVKNYQKSMIDNNLLLFITIIIIIGFMITDSFFKPNMKEGFGSCDYCEGDIECGNQLYCDGEYSGSTGCCQNARGNGHSCKCDSWCDSNRCKNNKCKAVPII